MNSFGLVGNLCLSFCGLFLLYDTIKYHEKTSYKFIIVWLLGEILALIFAIYKCVSIFIIGNYLISILIIILVTLIQLFRNKNVKI